MALFGARKLVAVFVAAGAVATSFGTGVARADTPLLTVTPSNALADGAIVSVTVAGLTPTPLGRIFVAECANAYGNGTPLATVDPNTDCETAAWIDGPNGTIDYTAKQTGIGSGNRACIPSPPALAPCYIYTPSGINVPTFPAPVDIFFAGDITGTPPEPTATTITAVGSPIASGKTAHALVVVTDGPFAPDGTVTVTAGATQLGSATLVDGTANVALGVRPLGTHPIVAHYGGNGSFASSNSAPTNLDVISQDNISIGDVAVYGGVGGARSVTFPVVLSHKPAANVTVNYAVTAGSAVPGVDYSTAGTTGVLTFKAGKQNIRYVTVKLLADTHTGGSRTFNVDLSPPTGGFVIRKGHGAGTIVDPATGGPTINVGSAGTPEGDAGTPHAVRFPVTLSAPQPGLVTAIIQVLPGSATRAAGDYGGAFSRTVVFSPGSVTKPLSVPINSDVASELDEGFTVKLVSVTGGVALGQSAVGVILSDE